MEQKIEGAKNQVLCLLDEKIYPREAALQAAYRFIGRCYVKLERSSDRLAVRLKGKSQLSAKKLAALADEFANELLHQLVREQVSRRTARLREQIVARALLSAEPLPAGQAERTDSEPATECDADTDYLDDPLGIAIPWEEKYGEQAEKNGRKSKKR